MQMIIGDYMFTLDSAEYSKLQRSQSWRWQAHERLNRKPAMQYQGAGALEITLSGTIHVQTERHLKQPERMKAEADKGEPLNILASNDTLKALYLGRWVITKLSWDEYDLLGNGTPKTIDFTMVVKEYGDDDVIL